MEQGPNQSQTKEFENLLERLEKITVRLEEAVPVLEKSVGPLSNHFAVTKSLEDLLDEHINLFAPKDSEDKSENPENPAISPDSSADFEELSEKDLTINDNEILSREFERILNSTSDKSENSSNSQNTVVSKSVTTAVNGRSESGEDSPRLNKSDNSDIAEDFQVLNGALDKPTGAEQENCIEEEEVSRKKTDDSKVDQADMTNSKWPFCACSMFPSCS